MERYDKADLEAAKQSLQNGGVILYPTDTIWGLGCLMNDIQAFKTIFNLKNRAKDKKCILLFASEIQLERHFDEIPEQAWQLMEYAEKPLTLVLDGAKNIPKHLCSADGSLAVRLVKDPFCQHLIQQLKSPIVSTSANLSGHPSPKSFAQVSEDLKHQVDYVVRHKQAFESRSASTIIKLGLNGDIKILRK
ncbi:MAG: L-threonylcarbamoyladenylate synthase [Flavobacteriales bacterium]